MAMPPVTVEVQNEEKPLGVVTEVAYNIFFVAVAQSFLHFSPNIHLISQRSLRFPIYTGG